METPPRIDFDAPAPPRKSFAFQAAKMSLAAPGIAVLVNIVWRAGQPADAINRTATLIVGLTAMILIVLGFVGAVIALCGVSHHGRKGLLGRGLVGLIINGVLIGVFIVGFISGFNKSRNSKKSMAELDAVTKEFVKDVRATYDPEQGMTNMPAEALQAYRDKLQTLSTQTSGAEGQMLQAISAYTAKMELATRAYSRVAEELQRGEVLNFSTLTDSNMLTGRRELVHRFQKANTTLRQTLSNQTEIVENELKSRQLSPGQIKGFLAGFRKSSAPIQARALSIRDCDERFSQAMLAVLDLADTNWGRWRFNPTEETVLFEDDEAHQTFSQLLDQITAIGEEQVRLQGEMLELQRKAMERRK